MRLLDDLEPITVEVLRLDDGPVVICCLALGGFDNFTAGRDNLVSI